MNNGNILNNQEIKANTKHENAFFRIGKTIEKIKDILNYKFPDPEKIVRLYGLKEIKTNMEKQNTFIDENNFRLQIGKMQENGETIYRPMMLKFGLEYIANHVKLDEKGNGQAIIQLWPDLAQALAQDNKQILSFEEEKEKIEILVKKILGKKRKYIQIQNVADNYPDVFNAIKKGKQGIIPAKEPNFDELDKPLKSPLPIIEYLAYHCQQNQELMQLFYNTKPDKYIGQDYKKGSKPGDSNADYYSVVEVGIRLFEIINGINIQGGIGRQRVYDKIISLILFGKDRIGKYGKQKPLPTLTSGKYKALEKMHIWIVENYKNISMQQLYIELDEKSLPKLEGYKIKKDYIKSKLKKAGIITSLLVGLGAPIGMKVNNMINDKIQRNNENKKFEEFIDDYNNKQENIHEYDEKVGIKPFAESSVEANSIINHLNDGIYKLLAEYDLSKCDYYDERGHLNNKVIDMFTNMFLFVQRYRKSEKLYDYEHRLFPQPLTSEEFLKYFWKELILDYGISYQKPYEHLVNEKYEAIVNTLKYGNIDSIAKMEIFDNQDVEGEKIYTYYIDDKYFRWDKQNYRLKFVKCKVGDQYKEFVLARCGGKRKNSSGRYTFYNGLRCMKDLQKRYGFSELENIDN